MLHVLFCLLAGIQLSSEPTIDLLDVLSPAENLRFHFACTCTEFLGDSLLFIPCLLEADELRDVLYPVNDVGDLPVDPEDRRIDRTPIPFFKSPSVGVRAANIVLLNGHDIRYAML